MSGKIFPKQYHPTAKWPGEVVDEVGGGITGAVQSIVSTIGGGIRNAGEKLQEGLDKPADSMGLNHSPFRIIDDPLKGTTMAMEGAINDGAIDGVRVFWSSVTDAIDRIPDTFVPRGDGRLEPPWGKGGRPGLPWDVGRRT